MGASSGGGHVGWKSWPFSASSIGAGVGKHGRRHLAFGQLGKCMPLSGTESLYAFSGHTTLSKYQRSSMSTIAVPQRAEEMRPSSHKSTRSLHGPGSWASTEQET